MAGRKFPTREEFIASYLRQTFSLPDSMIYYITKNLKSSKCYQKLIQACKHFFIKNQILVIGGLKIDGDKWEIYSNGTTCCVALTQKTKIAVQNLKSPKIWVVKKIYVSSTKSSKFASDLIPKIYQCDAVALFLINQRLSFEQFQFYSRNAKTCYLRHSLIYSEADSEMPIETVIANLPSLRQIWCDFHSTSKNVSKDTVAKLLQIPHFKNIIVFHLYRISSDFDMDTFYDYYKKNKHMDCLIGYKKMSSLEYAAKLDGIIDEILADKSRPAKPLGIWYPGQLRSKRTALFDLREQ